MSEQITYTPEQSTANPNAVIGEQPEYIEQQEAEQPELTIRHHSFEEAQQAEKKYSDDFIDAALDEAAGGIQTFQVGTEKVGLKGFLDKVEATEEDRSIIESPEAIAAVYLETTDMLARNLKIKVAKGMHPDRIQEIAATKSEYLTRLKTEAPAAADKIVEWVEAGDARVAPRPGEELCYAGFDIDDKGKKVDIFEGTVSDLHPNIKVQRQGGGNFIFGYSDARIEQRMSGTKDTTDQRIYLNPTIMQTPQIFEKVLQSANEAGIPLELKMLQRSEELGAAHIEKGRDETTGDALRGDGVVIYTSAESANDVLALALAIAQDQPDAFVGRKTSRIPQKVADGVAIGSEPEQRPGEDRESLSSHRSKMLTIIAAKVAESGKTGQEARDSFRRGVEHYSKRDGINPQNIAFNETKAA